MRKRKSDAGGWRSLRLTAVQRRPHPSRHFPDLNFNQMVLKAVFTGVPVSRIVGLAARASSDLARMAEAYASERRAAGRPVPSDVGHIRDLARSTA